MTYTLYIWILNSKTEVLKMGGGPRPAGVAKTRALRDIMAKRQAQKPKPQGAGDANRTKQVVNSAYAEYRELQRQAHEKNKQMLDDLANGIYNGAQSETEIDLMDRFYGDLAADRHMNK